MTANDLRDCFEFFLVAREFVPDTEPEELAAYRVALSTLDEFLANAD